MWPAGGGGGTQTTSPGSACLLLLTQAQKGDRHPWIPDTHPVPSLRHPFWFNPLPPSFPPSLPFFSSFY